MCGDSVRLRRKWQQQHEMMHLQTCAEGMPQLGTSGWSKQILHCVRSIASGRNPEYPATVLLGGSGVPLEHSLTAA